MKFSMSVVAALASALYAASPVMADERDDLKEWWDKTPPTIFPGNNPDWKDAIDEIFASDASITFNFKDHDVESFKEYLQGTADLIDEKYEYLTVESTGSVSTPDVGNGKAGVAVMTGMMQGKLKDSDEVKEDDDAVYAEINSEGKIAVWREFVNFK